MSEYQELQDKFCETLDVLISLDRKINKFDQRIGELETQGMTDATIHWRRKDDPGKPDMLELVHHSGSVYAINHNGRRREYVGTDPEQIKAALEKRRRFDEWGKLRGQRARIQKQADNIRWAIRNVFRVAGEQQELWGQNGDNGEWGQQNKLQPANMSPQAKSDVSPRGMSPRNMAEVRAYFEQSPILSDIAKDIPNI